jgi:hypothetical protein
MHKIFCYDEYVEILLLTTKIFKNIFKTLKKCFVKYNIHKNIVRGIIGHNIL